MKKLSLVVLALATALATAPAATADSFGFAVSGPAEVSPAGPTITGGGTLTGINEGGGAYDIQTSSGVSFTIGGTLYTAAIVANPTYPVSSNLAGDTYDDKFTPGTSPYVDGDGLLFLLSNGNYLDIFYNSAQTGLYANQDLWNEFNSDGIALINNAVGGDPLAITTTPEPSSLLLMGTGLLLMAGFLFRRNALQGVL